MLPVRPQRSLHLTPISCDITAQLAGAFRYACISKKHGCMNTDLECTREEELPPPKKAVVH